MHYFGAKLTYFLYAFIFLGFIYFIDSLAKREKAKNFAARLVANYKLQFLDDSIYCSKITLVRDERAIILFKRQYNFYASPFSNQRLSCSLVLLNNEMIDWYIEPYHEKK